MVKLHFFKYRCKYTLFVNKGKGQVINQMKFVLKCLLNNHKKNRGEIFRPYNMLTDYQSVISAKHRVLL